MANNQELRFGVMNPGSCQSFSVGRIVTRDSSRRAFRHARAVDDFGASRLNNLVGAHHLIVFVLENVAMPHVSPSKTLEGDNNSRDHS